MPTPPPTGPLVTRDTVAAQLRELGVRPGETLLAHTSLSSLGWVCGGAVSLVRALLDALTPDGTLVVPTQTGDLSDPAHWGNPPVPREWWDTIRTSMPSYDPLVTPSRGVGVIPETVRTWPGAERSAHPQTSFAALGPRASEIVAGHATDCRLGERSPLARLEGLDARVLLLGAGYDACTSFHLAEYRVPSPPVQVGRPGADGWETVTEVSITSDRFDELGQDFERDRTVLRGKVGAADARLFPVADAVAYAERWLPLHRPREEEIPSGEIPHPPACGAGRVPRLGPMRSEPVLQVQALVKRYGTKTAVNGLDLVAHAGVTAVLGPNGAGKTTTVETCEGYRKPDSGTVRVLGLDPVRESAALRPRIGVMLQSGGVYSGARADEMLRHIAKLHAHPLDVDALIERLGLGSCGRTTYRRLSGGQQQRLALAMAVVGRPELVFLDEPTAGLDPQARRATWDLVRDLRTDGVSVVLTTHHMDEAEQLADDVAIIDAGRVIAHGSPEDLCRGGAENTLRFSGRPGLDVGSLLKALPADSTAVELTPGSYRVGGKVDPQLLATVTSWCAQHGVMPEKISVERHTLEDVFLELTGKELRS